ncbi:hypothetical protein V8C26DRAFT_429015 [Trichoderma gracile]
MDNLVNWSAHVTETVGTDAPQELVTIAAVAAVPKACVALTQDIHATAEETVTPNLAFNHFSEAFSEVGKQLGFAAASWENAGWRGSRFTYR